jgi:ATP-dependent DNA helicase 2 subunit 2
VRTMSNYEGKLFLGDIEKYPETTMSIDVKRYFKTKIARPAGASSYVSRMSNGNGETSAQSSHTLNEDTPMTNAPMTGDGLSIVRSAFTYKINDASAPGGKRDVPRDELAKGYEYGRTAVPISQDEENVTKLETKKSFTIIGFVPSDQVRNCEYLLKHSANMSKYEKYLTMGESCITIAQTVSDKARLGFSSLIHALYELESYAIARLVKKDGADPQIVCMAPLIEPDLEALIDVPLPFAEDVRVYRFPPLDRVITTSGAILTKHRYLPSDDLVEAMSDYVDSEFY